MKQLLALALLACALTAHAETTTLPPLQFDTHLTDANLQGQQQGQTATSDSTATNEGSGNGNSITFNSPGVTDTKVKYSGTQTIKNVPSVSGPPLTTSNDTCMGSTSGSVNIAGLGIGGGSTWTDTNCKRLKNARELWNMGMKGAGMALMCMDAENRQALTSSGYECPKTKDEQQAAKRNEVATNGSVIAPSATTSPIVGY